jgi:hypothetical protein
MVQTKIVSDIWIIFLAVATTSYTSANFVSKRDFETMSI